MRDITWMTPLAPSPSHVCYYSMVLLDSLHWCLKCLYVVHYWPLAHPTTELNTPISIRAAHVIILHPLAFVQAFPFRELAFAFPQTSPNDLLPEPGSTHYSHHIPSFPMSSSLTMDVSLPDLPQNAYKLGPYYSLLDSFWLSTSGMVVWRLSANFPAFWTI